MIKKGKGVFFCAVATTGIMCVIAGTIFDRLTLLSVAEAALPAPGGLDTSLVLWLKADTGTDTTTDGAEISSWADQSGTSNHGSTPEPARKPLYHSTTDSLNFNPVVEFTDDIVRTTNMSVYGANGTYTKFAVIKPTTFGIGNIISSDEYNSNALFLQNGLFRLWHNGISFVSGGTLSTGQSYVLSGKYTAGGPTPNEVRVAGATTGTSTAIQAYSDPGFIQLGALETTQVSNVQGYFATDIAMAEIVVYTDVLTTDQMRQVESYLALKYGTTLDSGSLGGDDYFDGQGASVYDLTQGYSSHVAGIGRDDDTSLNQQISKSVNSGSVLTISTDDDFVGLNGTHEALSDGQYFVVGSNGQSVSATSSEFSNVLLASRISREWRYENTGSVAEVGLKFDGFDDDYVLLRDSDGNFSSGSVIAGSLDVDGEILVSLPDTAYFTLAKKATVSAGTLVLSDTNYPSYKIFQRDTNDEYDFELSGLYDGTCTAVEASFDGGAYSVIDSSPDDGFFSGTLTGSVGQGTLSVRCANDALLSDSVTNIGIGDVYVVAGQSNAEGHGQNAQNYMTTGPNATVFPTVYTEGDLWKVGNDDTDPHGRAGSVWPLLGGYIAENTSVPVAFITTADGGKALTGTNPYWTKGSVLNCRNGIPCFDSMVSQVSGSGVNSVKAILWFHGESDASDGVSRSAYEAALRQFLSDAQDDLPGTPDLVAGVIGAWSLSPVNATKIRLATMDAWNNDPDIFYGPQTYDIQINDGLGEDNFHFEMNDEIHTLAFRWWKAIEDHYYDGSEGKGPTVVRAQVLPSGNQVTVDFVASSGLLPVSGLSSVPWFVDDDGSDVDVTSAAVSDSDSVLLTLASAVTSENITLTYAKDSTAEGLVVLTDSTVGNTATGVNYLPANPFSAFEVLPVGAPSDILITSSAVLEGQVSGTVVGTLTTVDDDDSDTHAYSLACAVPGADDSFFDISGSSLVTDGVFDYSDPDDADSDGVYEVCVRTTDSSEGSYSYDKLFLITVTEAVVQGSDNVEDDSSSRGRSGSKKKIIKRSQPLHAATPSEDTLPVGVPDHFPVSSCPHFTSYFVRGQTSDEVAKWQDFLNHELGLSIPLTGFYGNMTDSALRQFQAKYSERILAPWGLSVPTGMMYKTTRAQANSILGCSVGTVDLDGQGTVAY